jgi:hypothetical protein
MMRRKDMKVKKYVLGISGYYLFRENGLSRGGGGRETRESSGFFPVSTLCSGAATITARNIDIIIDRTLKRAYKI